MSAATEARLALVGWNFRTVPSGVSQRVAFTPEEVREALRQMLGRGYISEAVIVSTCHRSEIYSVSLEDGPGESLTRFVSEWRGVDHASLASESFQHLGADAVRHLFRVAGGLDSIALGESEVLGQVRQALALAKESGSTRAVLHRLFESAVAAGKRVRTETQIATHPLSITSIGFELATKVFGDLRHRTVLLLGAGETGSSFARHAREAGVGELRIANRTEERAEELAQRTGGRAVSWADWPAHLAEADVVVGTTSSPEPLVRRSMVEEAMRARRGKPMFFLDLTVPHDIEPSLSEVYNVFAYSLNDLQGVAAENRARRAREIPIAETIIEQELGEFLGWMGNLSVVPTLTALRRRLDLIRDSELVRLPPEERERFRVFADSLAARLLHEPMRRLKSERDPETKLDRVEALRHLFDLDQE